MKRIQTLESDILRAMQSMDAFEISYSDIAIVDHDEKKVPSDTVRGHLYLLLDRNLVAEVRQNYWRIIVEDTTLWRNTGPTTRRLAAPSIEHRAPTMTIAASTAAIGRDGNELIHEVRTREAMKSQSRVPAIALTAFTRQQDRRLAIKSGSDAVCGKPLRLQELMSAIEMALPEAGWPA